jgi:hypothetical protein
MRLIAKSEKLEVTITKKIVNTNIQECCDEIGIKNEVSATYSLNRMM